MLTDDGERFLPWVEEPCVNYEHLHRYAFATQFVAGKKVLDLGSGEGYGSAMLAETATQVTAIDVSKEAVKHASSIYLRGNLRFVLGSMTNVPIEGEQLFDVIVCFEALEHIEEQETLMEEVKRLLKPEGSLIISTPNKYLFSEVPEIEAQFHVRELYFEEFRELILRNFTHARLYGHSVFPTSHIFGISTASGSTSEFVIEKGAEAFRLCSVEHKTARFLLAVCSDRLEPSAGSSYLVDESRSLFKLRDARIEKLEAALLERQEQLAAHETTVSELAARIGELEREAGRAAAVREQLRETVGAQREDVLRLRADSEMLAHIQRSKAWRLLRACLAAKDRALPAGVPLWRVPLRAFRSARRASASVASRIRGRLAGDDGRAAVRRQPTQPVTIDAVSIVAALYNKRREVTYFLDSVLRQTFRGTIELVLVDDASTDDTVQVVDDWFARHGGERDLCLKLRRHRTSMGNCVARNEGIGQATSPVIVVIDGDCMLNTRFVEAHARAHSDPFYQVVIGWVNLETGDADPQGRLREYERAPDKVRADALQQVAELPEHFLNCITRNFSIKREYAREEPLFDPAFSYTTDPASGFGWEDTQMGYRLYERGLRIRFAPEAFSVHVSHPPSVPDSEQCIKSMRNFRRLHERHAELCQVAPRWTQETFGKIETWLVKHGHERNTDRVAVAEKLEDSVAVRPRRDSKRLRILSYRWHCGHQYEIFKLPHDFVLATGLSGLTTSWNYDERPLRNNVCLKELSEGDLDGFDVAILHMDEFVLSPGHARGLLSACWGDAFKFLRERLNIPMVVVCHGTPQFDGQCMPLSRRAKPGPVLEGERQRLVDYVGDVPVVCNSFEAMREWGFTRSRVIWQGFDPAEFPLAEYVKGAVAVPSDIWSRPHYRGLGVFQAATWGIPCDILGKPPKGNVQVQFSPYASYSRRNDRARARFRSYVDFLRQYSVFLNPTLRSPMPRTRGEAMMCGLAVVTTPHHDASMFIDHGGNGFVSERPDELRECLKTLLNDPDLARTVGAAGRSTALDLFHIERFHQQWEDVLEDLVETGGDRMFYARGVDQPVDERVKRVFLDRPERVRVEVRGVEPDDEGGSPRPHEFSVPATLYLTGCGGEAGRYRCQGAVEQHELYGGRAMALDCDDPEAERALRSFDILVFHRVPLNGATRRLVDGAHRDGIARVYDADDLVFLEENADYFERNKATLVNRELVAAQRAMMRECRLVTCATETLAAAARTVVPSAVVLRNAVSNQVRVASRIARVARGKRPRRGEIVVGYASGSATHDDDFSCAAEGLAKAMREDTRLTLTIIGELNLPAVLAPFRSRIARIDWIRWQDLPAALAEFDINLAPLEVGVPFCEGKSELKYFEAGFVGVPTIASPTRVFRTAITDGENGLLAEGAEEWYGAIRELAASGELRERVGGRALEQVQDVFSATKVGLERVELMRDLRAGAGFGAEKQPGLQRT